MKKQGTEGRLDLVNIDCKTLIVMVIVIFTSMVLVQKQTIDQLARVESSERPHIHRSSASQVNGGKDEFYIGGFRKTGLLHEEDEGTFFVALCVAGEPWKAKGLQVEI